jgi:hypothetical protein
MDSIVTEQQSSSIHMDSIVTDQALVIASYLLATPG